MGSRTIAFRFAVCLLAFVPAACGGGAGGGSSALPGVPAGLPGGASSPAAAVAFTITIPSGTATNSSHRRARYISAATKSAVLTFGTSRQVADCASTCSMTLQVPPGQVTFTATLYDGPAGTGNVLSVGQTTLTVAPGQANAIGMSFGGMVAKVSLALSAPAVAAGTPATIPVTVNAQDAAGFTIVGPEPYVTPIRLANDDATGATALSTTAVDAPNTPVTLAYNGGANMSSAHISASVAGGTIAPSTVTLTVQSAPASAPQRPVPTHASSWYYYGLNHVNETIPAAWMAAHADYAEDDGFSAEHATAFKNAGGKYAVAYSDTAYVPYCYAPFVAPVKPCDGPVGNRITDESAWFHGPDGARVHHFVDNEFQYQEALNPASPAARTAYHDFTQRLVTAAPSVDYFFADDGGGTFLGPDGTQLSGWFYGFNSGAVEMTTDAQFIPANQAMLASAARPVIVNGYDVATRLPAYGGKWLDSPNVVGGTYEGCYSFNGGVASDETGKWVGHSNGLLMTVAHRSKALCMMTAASSPANRIYLMASWWMTYTEPYSIAAPLTATRDGFTVLPEYDIVPREPRATATNSIAALRSSSGAYVREFAACYQAGSPIGPCAAIVNTSFATVSMPALAGAYTRTLAVDDKSSWTGGKATWSGTVPAQLGPVSAVVVR